MTWANFQDAYTTTAQEVLGAKPCRSIDYITLQKNERSLGGQDTQLNNSHRLL